MGLFDKQQDFNDEEIENLRREKLRLEEEYKKVKEYVELKVEVDKAKKAVKDLKSVSSNKGNGEAGNVIKATFQGIGSVLGEMASNSQANNKGVVKKQGKGA